MNCPSCSAEIGEAYSFCPQCGSATRRKGAESGPGSEPNAGIHAGATRIEVPSDVDPQSPTVDLGPGAARRPDTTFAAGDLVGGRYRIVRFVAEGGMGEVYEAEDGELGGRLALKTVRPALSASPGVLERFRREIQIARRVTHPNVCRIFDVGYHELQLPRDGQNRVTFLTMELLGGESLAQRLAGRGPFTSDEALPILRQIVDALASAHAAGVVHRDFKTANVMLVPSPRGERVVVTDFGLARAVEDESMLGAALTTAGEILGSPAYMAPEQVAGGTIGPATDVYALGIVIYELLTGKWPFEADSALSLAAKRLTEPPRPIAQLVPGLSPAWIATIERCLARKPEERFQVIREVLTALDGGFTAGARSTAPSGATTVSPQPQASRSSRRTAWIGAGIVAFLGAVGAVVWLRQSSAPPAATAAPAPTGALVQPARRAVAVLGLENLGSPDQAWLATALAEILRTEMTVGDQLRGIPAEAIARTRLELALPKLDSLAPASVTALRDRTGADLLLFGSYLVAGSKGSEQLRVDLRVQECTSGEIVATAGANGTLDRMFDLVTEVSGTVRGRLGVAVPTSAELGMARATVIADPEVARLYASGLEKLRAFDPLGAQSDLQTAAALAPEQALVRAALATSWLALGFDENARKEAEEATRFVQGISRAERMLIEGLRHEAAADWTKAIDVYSSLFSFYSDQVDYGLRLAAAQTAAGQGEAAQETIARLRTLPPPSSGDPRIDLAEAAAAKSRNDFEAQRRAAQSALNRANLIGSTLLAAQAQLQLGIALVNLGELDAAVAAAEKAKTTFEAAGDLGSVAQAENTVAVAEASRGNLDDAKRRFQAALAASTRVGHRRGVAKQLLNLSNIEFAQGRADPAVGLVKRAISVAQEIGDKGTEASAWNNLGALQFDTSRLGDAEVSYRKALELWRQSGEQRNLAQVLFNLGELLERREEYGEARTALEESLALSKAAGSAAEAGEALTHLARIHAVRGDSTSARRAIDEALSQFAQLEERDGAEAEAWRLLAEVAKKQGDSKRSLEAVRKAEEIERAIAAGAES